MKHSGIISKNKYAMWIYGMLFISAMLPALLAVKNINISPDSMIYALMSQEILSGSGLRLPIIINMEYNHVFINGSVPFPAKPPLLPILYAILGGVTPQSFLAAQIINVISHVVISIFTFMLMKKLYDNKGIALLTGILVSLSFPLLRNTHYMLSETLFIALTVAALYFLVLSRHCGSRQFIRNLFIAGICGSAAILTKFTGAALIPVFAWEAFISVKNKRIKSKYVSAVSAIMLPVITMGALFIRNLIISGTIQGWNPPPPERSYLSAFTGTIKMLYLQFDLGKRPVTLITIFAISLILYIILNADARRELSRYVHSGLDLIIVFIISFTMLISYAMATSQTVFELRYMSPLVPFLFILCIIIIVFVGEMLRLKGFSKLSLCGIILSLGIITFGNCYKTYLHSQEFSYRNARQYFILNSSTYKWIKENYGENVIITTNKPYHLSFFGGYSTIQLPHKRFNKNTRIPEDMELFLPDRMSGFGSRVLALFEEAEEQYEGSYVSGLFNKREDDDSFVLIHKFPDGVVYNLKE